MELKDVLEAIGFQGDAEGLDREKLVQHINQSFVPRDKAFEDEGVRKQAFGRVFGEISGKLAPILGKSKSEIQEMGNDKAFEALGETFAGLNTKLTDVEAKAKEGQSKQVLDLEDKLADYEKSLGQYKTAAQEAREAAEAALADRDKGIHTYKLEVRKKDIFGSIPWSSEVNEFTRKGIEFEFNDKYVMDLDEKDEPIVKTRSGELIPDPKKAGAFLGPKDVLTSLAEKAGALKVNNAGKAEERKAPANTSVAAGGDDWLAKRQAQRTSKSTQY
jgi:hypothetical protein